ncbi:9899_t:CDS:2 [Funneliformis geosporum]|nr:9899_t:CDS:2 [Funneliformis geosporum]
MPGIQLVITLACKGNHYDYAWRSAEEQEDDQEIDEDYDEEKEEYDITNKKVNAFTYSSIT